MRKNTNDTWEFNGDTYKIGNPLNEGYDDSVYPVVAYKNKIYKAVIKPERPPRLSRVGLWDIYDENRKPYWTTVDKVYQVIKINLQK